MILTLRGGGLILHLDPKMLDDFTNLTFGNKEFKRGSRTYQGPYGWKMIAIKVGKVRM